MSPQPVSSRMKRMRVDIDLMNEKEKGKFNIHLCWHDRKYFESASVILPHVEKLMLDGLDQPT